MTSATLYSATGNRLWVLEVIGLNDAKLLDYTSLAQILCQNKCADGVMLMNPESLRLWILNADGSNGEFCGNGLRAVAYHLQKTRNMKTATLQMAEHNVIHATMEGEAVSVCLDIGQPVIHTEIIQGVSSYRLTVPNPHLIILNPPKHWQIEAEGKALSHTYNTNVEWVYPESDQFYVTIYERGVGPTAACGSGALATFKTLQSLGLVKDQANLRMPGGNLTVTALCDRLCTRGTVVQLATSE